MLTESNGSGAWGGLSTSVKTMAMGAAGVALWGSLGYFFVSGMGASDATEQVTAPADRLFLRFELPETSLLDGCTENFYGTTCGDKAWVILTEMKSREGVKSMPSSLADAMPAPLWDDVVARYSVNDSKCQAMLEEELPGWIYSGSRALPGLHATLVPDRFTSCRTTSASLDPVQGMQAYWIMDGPQIVAEMRCSLPGTRDAECQLTAYPEHGKFVAAYSRLPASNAAQIVDQSPQMMQVLAMHLPDSAKGRVDLAFLDGEIAFDDASAHAVASLQDAVR